MGKVYQKDDIKRSKSSIVNSGGSASNKIMRSKTMQEKASNQASLFGDAASTPENTKTEERYVKTKKSKAYIRVGLSEESKKIDTSGLEKGSIFLVEKETTTMDTSGFFRTKHKEYFRIKAPVVYKNLWLKESHTDNSKAPKSNNLDDVSKVIESQIYEGTLSTREDLFRELKNNKISLNKQVKLMEVYEAHRKSVTNHVDKIIDNIDKYKTIEEVELALKSVRHSQYDKIKVRNEFIKSKKSKNEDIGVLAIASNANNVRGATTSLLTLDSGLKSTEASLAMATHAKEEAGTVFSEAGGQITNVWKDIAGKSAFSNIGSFMKKIKKFLSSPAIPLLSTILGGIVTLGLNIKSTWDSYKLLSKFKNAKSESIEMIKDAVDYGYKKIRRAFWGKVQKLFSSVIGFASKLAAILSGGLLAGVALAVSTFNTVISSLTTLYKKTKGFYKFIKGTRGANREKYAAEVVFAALDKNDNLSQEFMIKVMPKVDISGSESTKILISKYRDLDNKKQDIYKKSLIKEFAKAMKSQ